MVRLMIVENGSGCELLKRGIDTKGLEWVWIGIVLIGEVLFDGLDLFGEFVIFGDCLFDFFYGVKDCGVVFPPELATDFA